MPCPHNEISIVQRSQQQSAVAAAAYQSGEKLFCGYDQEVKHYPEKRGIVHNEILLPANAPRSYADRNTLWNAAEAVEKQWNSQLARRWVLTIPREIPPDQYAVLVREFCEQQFVSYCGLRREEILALQWDCVFLDVPAPYLSVKRAWHTEHNRPVILDALKTSAAKRDIPIPPPLADCLKEVKAKSQSPFVVANRDGKPLSYTQFQRVWKYIVTRSNKERTYVRYVNGQKIKHTVTPALGEKAPHNGKVVYSLDFQVTPHQLRHTYITNLIYAGVDPKTVQYLAGHENSKITMDIYAKVKYNSPDALSTIVNNAFNNMYAKAE